MIVESYEDVIHLSGALRSNFWETIHTAISLTLKRHPSGVIIDCTAITECTPEGADTFLDAIEFIEGHEARVICVGVPPQVMEVLKGTPGVRSQLPVAASIEAARTSLDLLAESVSSKKRGPQMEVKGKIVMHLTGRSRDAHAFDIVERMSQSLQAEVLLAYVVIVPRELPLASPMAEQEEAGKQVIDQAKAVLSARGVPHSAVVERGRDVPSALQSLVQERDAQVLVMPLSNKAERLEDDLKTVKSALAKVTVSVIFVRPPLQAGA